LVAGGPWASLEEAPAGTQTWLWLRAPWRGSLGGCLLGFGHGCRRSPGEAVTRVWFAVSGQLGR